MYCSAHGKAPSSVSLTPTSKRCWKLAVRGESRRASRSCTHASDSRASTSACTASSAMACSPMLCRASSCEASHAASPKAPWPPPCGVSRNSRSVRHSYAALRKDAVGVQGGSEQMRPSASARHMSTRLAMASALGKSAVVRNVSWLRASATAKECARRPSMLEPSAAAVCSACCGATDRISRMKLSSAACTCRSSSSGVPSVSQQPTSRRSNRCRHGVSRASSRSSAAPGPLSVAASRSSTITCSDSGWSKGRVWASTPMMKGVGVWLTSVSGSGWRAAGRNGMKTPEKDRGESRWHSAAETGRRLATSCEVMRRCFSSSAASRTSSSSGGE
eukprot:scaffold28926_cov63-Phaeocystis_antarctica.AAC.6